MTPSPNAPADIRAPKSSSAAATATRERLQAIAENDPVFKKSFADYSRPRPERYRRAMAKQRRLLELTAELKLKEEAAPQRCAVEQAKYYSTPGRPRDAPHPPPEA